MQEKDIKNTKKKSFSEVQKSIYDSLFIRYKESDRQSVVPVAELLKGFGKNLSDIFSNYVTNSIVGQKTKAVVTYAPEGFFVGYMDDTAAYAYEKEGQIYALYKLNISPNILEFFTDFLLLDSWDKLSAERRKMMSYEYVMAQDKQQEEVEQIGGTGAYIMSVLLHELTHVANLHTTVNKDFLNKYLHGAYIPIEKTKVNLIKEGNLASFYKQRTDKIQFFQNYGSNLYLYRALAESETGITEIVACFIYLHMFIKLYLNFYEYISAQVYQSVHNTSSHGVGRLLGLLIEHVKENKEIDYVETSKAVVDTVVSWAMNVDRSGNIIDRGQSKLLFDSNNIIASIVGSKEYGFFKMLKSFFLDNKNSAMGIIRYMTTMDIMFYLMLSIKENILNNKAKQTDTRELTLLLIRNAFDLFIKSFLDDMSASKKYFENYYDMLKEYITEGLDYIAALDKIMLVSSWLRMSKSKIVSIGEDSEAYAEGIKAYLQTLAEIKISASTQRFTQSETYSKINSLLNSVADKLNKEKKISEKSLESSMILQYIDDAISILDKLFHNFLENLSKSIGGKYGEKIRKILLDIYHSDEIKLEFVERKDDKFVFKRGDTLSYPAVKRNLTPADLAQNLYFEAVLSILDIFGLSKADNLRRVLSGGDGSVSEDIPSMAPGYATGYLGAHAVLMVALVAAGYKYLRVVHASFAQDVKNKYAESGNKEFVDKLRELLLKIQSYITSISDVNSSVSGYNYRKTINSMLKSESQNGAMATGVAWYTDYVWLNNWSDIGLTIEGVRVWAEIVQAFIKASMLSKG